MSYPNTDIKFEINSLGFSWSRQQVAHHHHLGRKFGDNICKLKLRVKEYDPISSS